LGVVEAFPEIRGRRNSEGGRLSTNRTKKKETLNHLSSGGAAWGERETVAGMS